MNRFLAMIVCSLLLVCSTAQAASDISLNGAVGAGGEYDTNLNHATSGNDKKSSVAAVFGLKGMLSFTAAGFTRFYLNAEFEMLRHDQYDDLDSEGYFIRAGATFPAAGGFFLEAEPFIGVRDYAEGDLDATVYGITFLIRKIMTPELTVSAYYTASRNDAKADVFTYSSSRFGIKGEYMLTEETHFRAGYFVDFRENYFYLANIFPLPAAAKDPKASTVFGPSETVYRDDATIHNFSAGVDQYLDYNIYLLVDYAYSRLVSDSGNYNAHLLTGKAEYRF